MKSTNFSVIIPNFNGAELLSTCLKSLHQSLSLSKSKIQIILIDNASTDNSLSRAKKIFPKIKVIKNPKNFGFAKAINQGIKIAQYPWIIPCNNDIKLHPQWFTHITKTIQNNKKPKVVTFFGTVLNKTGDYVESTGLEFNYSGKCKNINNDRKFDKSLTNQSPKVIWGGNASLIVYNKNVIQKIGLFDPDFFAYEEDVDLALRLHHLGYKTLWVPPAVSYHFGGATSDKMGNFRNRHDAKNWIYVILKNYSSKQILQNLPGIIEQRLRNLSGLLKNTPFFLWIPTVIHTYTQVIINLPKMLKKRHQIKKLKP